MIGLRFGIAIDLTTAIGLYFEKALGKLITIAIGLQMPKCLSLLILKALFVLTPTETTKVP
jgi:hypothetical protein